MLMLNFCRRQTVFEGTWKSCRHPFWMLILDFIFCCEKWRRGNRGGGRTHPYFVFVEQQDGGTRGVRRSERTASAYQLGPLPVRQAVRSLSLAFVRSLLSQLATVLRIWRSLYLPWAIIAVMTMELQKKVCHGPVRGQIFKKKSTHRNWYLSRN